MARASCVVCHGPIADSERHVLVDGKLHQAHCSEACLLANVRRQRSAKLAKVRLCLGGAAVAVLLVCGGAKWWQHHHVPQARAISAAWPEALEPEAPRPGPTVFGPRWPPSDDDWTAVLDQASWTYPLPGPVRRSLTVNERIFGPEPPREHPAMCRKEGRCGVDLGGELWGEHVYAALDGVVERVQGDGNEQHGGHYVRLSHLGGQVFTQYFHLAASPRGLVRGAHVQAGDVIGLLGDTGLAGARRRLHFALSIRPSKELPEVYWDPTQWLVRCSLRAPRHGTVAGFAP